MVLLQRRRQQLVQGPQHMSPILKTLYSRLLGYIMMYMRHNLKLHMRVREES